MAARDFDFVPIALRQSGQPLPFEILGWTVGELGAITVHFASGKSAPATEHPTIAHLRSDRRVREVKQDGRCNAISVHGQRCARRVGHRGNHEVTRQNR